MWKHNNSNRKLIFKVQINVDKFSSFSNNKKPNYHNNI